MSEDKNNLLSPEEAAQRTQERIETHGGSGKILAPENQSTSNRLPQATEVGTVTPSPEELKKRRLKVVEKQLGDIISEAEKTQPPKETPAQKIKRLSKAEAF